MCHAFSKQLLNLDEQFKVAVENATKPEAIQKLLNAKAHEYIHESINQEVKHYFLYGDGLLAIKEQVRKKLDEELETPN